MSVAIETRYIPPTDRKGERILATIPSRANMPDQRYSDWRIVKAWDYELSEPENHRAAAEALKAHLGWDTAIVGGELGEAGRWVWVFIP